VLPSPTSSWVLLWRCLRCCELHSSCAVLRRRLSCYQFSCCELLRLLPVLCLPCHLDEDSRLTSLCWIFIHWQHRRFKASVYHASYPRLHHVATIRLNLKCLQMLLTLQPILLFVILSTYCFS
jgi:hypothetical protein